MPRKDKPEELLERLDWVRKLPESVWAQGIIGTAEYVCDEISSLQQEKRAIDDKIRQRMKVLRLMSPRAEREAPLMYDEAVVDAVKPPIEPEATDEQP